MNIIKLKDVIKENDDLFNNNFKGKYVYWVHTLYMIPFDIMSPDEYIYYEQLNNEEIEEKYYGKYIVTDINGKYGPEYKDYIDIIETDRINDVTSYINKNQFSPDSDITLDELKVFRTWLAKTLLKLDKGTFNPGTEKTDKDTINMLIYYAKGMFDPVIEGLTDMSEYNDVKNVIDIQCGCCGTSPTVDSIYQNNLNICDPISTYRHYIYNKMVATFSDVDFWTKYPESFILTFKHYIDNIIKSGLKLYKSQYVSNFVDCGGLSIQENEQNQNLYILRKLSESLQFIADKNISKHKNYIGSSLYEWSSILYEMMEWV